VNPRHSPALIWVTDTQLWVAMTFPVMRKQGLATLAAAIEEWMTFHGIGPSGVLLYQPIERDPIRCQIRFPAFVGECLSTRVEQGEASPLPWPDDVWEHSPGTQSRPGGRTPEAAWLTGEELTLRSAPDGRRGHSRQCKRTPKHLRPTPNVTS
jgi:hypothetical protein